jgi:4-hydroxybenzoate polyprenyltransferase
VTNVEVATVVILGIVLLLLGILLNVPILTVLGLVLIVVGLVVNLAYARPRGGRLWY